MANTPKFLDGERISHFTTEEGGMWILDKNLLDMHNIKTVAKEQGIHSVYTTKNRRWDEIGGWEEPDKVRWVQNKF